MKNIWEDIKNNIKANKKQAIIYLIVVVIAYIIMFSLMPKPETPTEVTYNEFLEYLSDGKIDTVYYNKNLESMYFTLLNDETKDMPLEERKTYEYAVADTRVCPYPGYNDFKKDVLMTGTNIETYNVVSAGNVVSVIVQIAFPLVFLAFFVGIMKGQMNNLSEKNIIMDKTDITFDDIIGQDEILDELQFITRLIKDPTIGEHIGAELPKGLLFIGPPGTGKTLLAKALANEAEVPFLYVSASSFVELYVGQGAKHVRELFRIARKHAPCILFIDEIDGLGQERGSQGNTAENDQTINEILQQMDGFKPRDGIFIIAATNNPEKLDKAVIRPGRFDRQVSVLPPRDWQTRAKLFKHYLDKLTTSDDIDIENISHQTSGFTGAEIAGICKDAGRIAVMKEKEAVDNECLFQAFDEAVFKSKRAESGVYENDRIVIAYHEAGHAIMSLLLDEPISRASIQPTTSGVGGAVIPGDKETMFMTNGDLKKRVMIAYAGRASEEIKFPEVTTGASNDISQATQVMLQYIEKFGFDKKFGMLDMGILANEHLVSSDIITKKLQQMSTELYDQCKKLLEENYNKVEILAQKLLERESIPGPEIKALISEECDEE